MKSWLVGLLLLSTGVAHSKMPAPNTASTIAPQIQANIQKVVSAIYRITKKGGIPDAKTQKQLKPLISPSLHTLLLQAKAIENQCFKVAIKGDKPHMVDGSLFSGVAEEPQKIEFPNAATKQGLEYHLIIKATYEDFSWENNIKLIPSKKTWLIDDITFRVDEKSSTNQFQTLRSFLDEFITIGKKECYPRQRKTQNK